MEQLILPFDDFGWWIARDIDDIDKALERIPQTHSAGEEEVIIVRFFHEADECAYVERRFTNAVSAEAWMRKNRTLNPCLHDTLNSENPAVDLHDGQRWWGFCCILMAEQFLRRRRKAAVRKPR